MRNDHAQIPRLAPGLNVADPSVSLEIAQAMAGRQWDAQWICPKMSLQGEATETVALQFLNASYFDSPKRVAVLPRYYCLV